MNWYAHSGTVGDKADWQLLADHLKNVAVLAGEMGARLGIEKAAFLAGLFHDLGKYTPEFQKRLEGEPISVDHSTAGAQVVVGRATNQHDKVMADLIAYAILGHHAGLPDRSGDSEACVNRRMERIRAIDSAWINELNADIASIMPSIIGKFPRSREEWAFSFAFLGRMIFSCLVDADFKDTEAFYAQLGAVKPDRDWPSLQDMLPVFLARFDDHMCSLPEEGALNELRRSILSNVRSKSDQPSGFFTLTVPTGGGKTLASLGFALDHAKAHGHERIIYAIPFTSIIDQTAGIFGKVLGEDYVLEHHSAIMEEQPGKEFKEQRDKLKLAMEDWAAPIVVTTSVQLFESLYSARTSRARKLHNIANSVIVLDEAQTVPRSLLKPIMRALRELVEVYGCTIILCTATQPALGKRPSFPDGLDLDGRELAPDPVGLSQRLARATIVHGGEMDNADLIAGLKVSPQALVIVNSRSHAFELYQEAEKYGLEGLFHLTTRQYAAHRKRILAEMRERLKEGRPCRLIATSLIEAGVDVDFPVAWRAEAGLDQIIQAAGRVNREGKRDRSTSVVTVFVAPDYPIPGEIKSLIGDMKRVITKHKDITTLAAIEDYFSEVYWRIGDGLDGKKILSRFKVHPNETDFAYRLVGEDFRMIESNLAPVIIATEEEAQEAVRNLGCENISSGSLARALQNYIVQVPPKARDLLIRNGHVLFARPDLRGDQFAILESKELYKEHIGLLWENADYIKTEDTLI